MGEGEMNRWSTEDFYSSKTILYNNTIGACQNTTKSECQLNCVL
jgi:hypothetical protein